MHLDHSKTTLKPRFKFKPDFRIRAIEFNATFDWQIYKFPLKASVQTHLANKEIKENLGYIFVSYFYSLKLKSLI